MELYNVNEIPLANDPKLRELQEKIIRNEPIGISPLHGRDRLKIVKKIGDYECKPDHCYRAIPENVLRLYEQLGYIADLRPNTREYEEQIDENGFVTNNNAGIDWYLGGAAPCRKYGFTIIECPADKKYFQLASDNGSHMTIDPTVRHIKSSPKANPIPFSMVTNVFDYKKILEEEQEKKQTEGKEQDTIIEWEEVPQQPQISPQTQELIDQAQTVLNQQRQIEQTINDVGRAR